MNELTYGISIYVEDSGKTYHTLDDWDLALGNNNYIGDPEMETTYIQVPGRTGLIDASEVISGRRIYKKRSLEFELGGIRDRLDWDGVISAFRNNIDGRVCRLTLDNDKSYYWRGRAYIRGFDRFRDLGTFSLAVPTADPYKYNKTSSAEPWLWDPFNFETDMITYIGAITVVGSASVTIPHGHMATSPELVVSDLTSPTFTVTANGTTYPLTVGTNRVPSILVGGDTNVELEFTGDAKVQIVYRSGSL
jgi:hypothetical protein